MILMSFQDMFESESAFQGALIGCAIIIIAIVATVVITLLKKRAGYKNKPIETVRAKALSKRNIVSNNSGAGMFIFFELENGIRQEFPVPSDAASTIVENDEGSLTHQGTKFIKFERTA